MKKIVNKLCAVALLGALGTTATSAIDLFSKNQLEVKAVGVENTITIEGAEKSATIGNTYEIPTATTNIAGATLTAITVTHNGKNQTIKAFNSSNTAVEDIMAATVTKRTVDVKYIGVYTITYTFTAGDDTYKSSVTFRGEALSATFLSVEGKLPLVIPADYAGDVAIPVPELVDAEGNQVEGASISAKVIAGDSAKTVLFNGTLANDSKIDFTSIKTENKIPAGNYTLKYSATVGGNLVAQSTTYTMEVKNNYEFKNAEFKYTFKSDPKVWELGKEDELPEVVSKMDGVAINSNFTVKKVEYEVDGTVADVTNRTGLINNKLFKPDRTGKYYITYEVKDYLGHTSTYENKLVLEVSDTTKPVIHIVEAYDAATATTYTDALHKMPTSRWIDETVVLMPMWVEDAGTFARADFKELRIVVRDESDSSKTILFDSNSFKASADAEATTVATNKELVFNKKAGYSVAEATQFDTGKNFESGHKYRVTYSAKDASGLSSSVYYDFSINAEQVVYTEPTITFNDTFANAIDAGEVITFNEPTYSDTIEESNKLLKTVEYRLHDKTATTWGNWTTLTAKDGKYTIDSSEDAFDGADKIELRAKATNDGNKTGYSETKTITIKNIIDDAAPEITVVGTTPTGVEQGDEVNLPTITVADTYIDYVNVDVKVEHIDEDKLTEMTVYDCSEVLTSTTKTVNAKVVVARSGNYRVTYTVKDAGNNYVVKFVEFTANPLPIEQKMTNLPTVINDGKLELGQSITLPVPDFILNETDTVTYALNLISGPSGSTLNKEKFTPTKVGTYKFKYVATVTLSDLSTKTIESAEYVIEVADTTKPTIFVDGIIPTQTTSGTSFTIPYFSADDANGVGVDYAKSYVRITSNSYTGSTLYLKDLQENSSSLTLTLSRQEEYTVTYYVVDLAGNAVTQSFKIAVGDTVNPEITLGENILPTKVAVGDTITIDPSKITVYDAGTTTLNADDVKIKLTNTDTGATVAATDTTGDGRYVFEVEMAGNYQFVFSVTDSANHTGTYTKTFVVDADDNDGTDKTQILGTILIVVSVLVLAGVIIYFIVSKKKTDKLYK